MTPVLPGRVTINWPTMKPASSTPKPPISPAMSKRHPHRGAAVGVLELVDGVAPRAVHRCSSRMAPTKKKTTTPAAVRLTHAGQALSSTKTAISSVANE